VKNNYGIPQGPTVQLSLKLIIFFLKKKVKRGRENFITFTKQALWFGKG